jgi:excisionase family DNA binding protein
MNHESTITPQTSHGNLLSYAETAKRLGVSRRTVERLVACGELTKVRIRGRVLFRAEEVANFISMNTASN